MLSAVESMFALELLVALTKVERWILDFGLWNAIDAQDRSYSIL